jgi:hypothetical protein
MAKNHKNKTKTNKHGKQTRKNPVHRGTGKDGKTWSIASMGKPASIIPGRINNVPYNVMQSVDGGALLTTSTTVPTFGAIYFTAGGLDQFSSFATVFDQYKIELIEAWLTPQFNPANGPNSEYCSVIDFDDTNNLTTYAQATDYQNAVESAIGIGQYRCFKPHVATATYSGTFTGYGNVESPWIDAVSSTVQHYGLKVAAQVTPAASTIHIVYRLHISFRNIR